MSRHIYTFEQDEFLKNNVKGITLKELRERFNKRFNLSLSESSIHNRKTKLHIKSGIVGGRFEKGHQTFNKGRKWDEYMPKQSQINSSKTTFKKGNIPFNHREVGSERINVDGYIEIKIEEPNKWDLKHRVVWRKKYGEIPEGYNIIFLDGNRQNVEISNLKAISKAEDLIMNNHQLFANNKEITNTGTIIAKVINKANEKKKK